MENKIIKHKLFVTGVSLFVASLIGCFSSKFRNVYCNGWCTMGFAMALRSLYCHWNGVVDYAGSKKVPEAEVLTWLSSKKPAKIKTVSRSESIIFCSEFPSENVFVNDLNGFQSNDVCFFVKTKPNTLREIITRKIVYEFYRYNCVTNKIKVIRLQGLKSSNILIKACQWYKGFLSVLIGSVKHSLPVLAFTESLGDGGHVLVHPTGTWNCRNDFAMTFFDGTLFILSASPPDGRPILDVSVVRIPFGDESGTPWFGDQEDIIACPFMIDLKFGQPLNDSMYFIAEEGVVILHLSEAICEHILFCDLSSSLGNFSPKFFRVVSADSGDSIEVCRRPVMPDTLLYQSTKALYKYYGTRFENLLRELESKSEVPKLADECHRSFIK